MANGDGNTFQGSSQPRPNHRKKKICFVCRRLYCILYEKPQNKNIEITKIVK